MSDAETIWIIGASDGIGAALAREWAKRGVHLVLSARSADKLAALASELDTTTTVLPLDVADPASLRAAAKSLGALPPLARVIHMAALYDPGKFVDLDPARAADIISVNLAGSFHLAQTAIPLLRPGGQLALCGSVAGYIGLPQGQIYSATKAGVINLAQSLRAELSGKVDVRLINPGFVDTRLTQRNAFHMPAMVTPEVAARAILKGLHARRFEIHFPRRLTLTLKLLSVLPYWASLPLTRRLTQ